jgi:hypothetical protein
MKTKSLKVLMAGLLIGLLFSQANAQTTGLSGTGANTQTAGTGGTDNTNVGANAGKIITTGGIQNTTVGKNAGTSITTADNNTCIGFEAGKVTTSGECTFVGSGSGASNTTGTGNTFTGFQAGKTSTVHSRNTFNGYQAGYSNGSSYYTGGSDHTFVGYQAGYSSGIGDNEGVATKNTFIGSFAGYSNTIGSKNTFMGYRSGYTNTTGYENTYIGDQAGSSNNTGSFNTFVGESSGSQNTTGSYNTYLGNSTGVYNTTGSNNTIVGEQAGNSSPGNNFSDNSLFGFKAGFQLTSGNLNSFFGEQSGYSNTTGSYNTFMGFGSGYATTTGYSNTASGFNALNSNTTGVFNCIYGTNCAVSQTTASNNCAFGYGALYNGTGGSNSAFGYNAGGLYSTGNNNTYIGNSADAGGSINNATALGNTTVVNATNKVRVGNTSVTVIEGQVAWSFPSDSRFKTNVTEDVRGLEFINRLRPVNYNFKTDEFEQFLMKNMPDSIKTLRMQGVDYAASMSIIHTGFIAQEVEQAAITSGYIFDGIHTPVNDDDNYSLAYSQFVVPLVKAVQELSKITDSLNANISHQDSINDLLQSQINQLTNMINICCSNIHDTSKQAIISNENTHLQNQTTVNVVLNNSKTIILDQNIPNPFAEHTVINYFLPENIGKAQMLFYNSEGKLIQSVDLLSKGKGSLNVLANDLSNGIYTYSLVIDGNVIETKKMMKQ